MRLLRILGSGCCNLDEVETVKVRNRIAHHDVHPQQGQGVPVSAVEFSGTKPGSCFVGQRDS